MTNDRQPPASPTEIPASGWRATLRRTWQQFRHDNVTDRAAALTYFGVLALFPGLLALISVLGFLGKGASNSFLRNVDQLAPGAVKSFLNTAIEHVQGRVGTASAAAIIGILLAVWSASSYIAAFMRAMNQIYNIDEGRPIWKTAPVRLAVTLAVLVMLIISVGIVVITGSIATQVGHALGIGHAAVLVWEIAKWPVLLLLVSVMISLLYWACPNVKQPGFRWITPGGVLAVVVWLIASGAFAGYVGVLRLLQQDVRHAGQRDRVPRLAVDHQHRRAARRGVQCRGPTPACHRRRPARGCGAVRRAA